MTQRALVGSSLVMLAACPTVYCLGAGPVGTATAIGLAGLGLIGLGLAAFLWLALGD